MDKRVVITGLGAITPIGKNVEENWNSIKEKKCGIDEITLFNTENFKTKLAAEVKEYNPLEHFEAKQAKRLDRSSQFAMVAAREAFLDSKITKENTDLEKVGVFVSSGIGGLTTIQEQCRIDNEKGNKRVSPMFIPMSIANMAAGNIAIEFGFKGESMSILTACASSTHAIGEAYKTIKLGLEDVVIAGGAEAAICEVGIAGFENMKALSFETDKNRASIPFDKRRNGFVMGEGAGIVVLEELQHAINRGANIFAEVVGYGATCDAYHITAPQPEAEGGARAIADAWNELNLDTDHVYINAHGTGTPLNDKAETVAIKKALGEERARKVLVSSTKSMTGHMFGAAGAAEAIASVLALQHQTVPPTIGLTQPDPECDLDYVPLEARKANIQAALSTSLGFGGHNACIAFRKIGGDNQ